MSVRPPLAPWERQRRLGQVAGFTFIEGIAVLVLLGVLGAYVLPKSFNTNTLTLGAQARNLAAHLQRAQSLAVATGSNVYFCTTSSAYLIQVGNPACPNPLVVTTPASQPVFVALENNANLSAAPVSLAFNSQGKPSTAGSFQLTAPGSSVSPAVAVSPLTGLVSLSSP